MSDKDRVNLICLPGLSTAEKITDLSGRGVGMDVVKTNIEKLGGKVDIHTVPGKGSNFRIKLPLTLAIIPSLIVSNGNERFAIPQINIRELIRIPAEQVQNRIELVGDVEVLLVRGELIPLIKLSDALGIEPTDRRVAIADRRSPKYASLEEREAAIKAGEEHKHRPGRRFHADSDINIVVVSTGSFHYGLIVEKLHSTVEIVVKPLGHHLKKLKEYAGSTVMGDGEVALILDIPGIAAVARLAPLTSQHATGETAKETEITETSDTETEHKDGADMQSFLLFHNAPGEQLAVPIHLVSRIESIAHDQVENLGAKRTMQYRGSSLPLVSLNDVAKAGSLTGEQEWVVLVMETKDREVGLLGARPLDVMESESKISLTHRQKGIMGSAILKKETTLLVDICEIVEQVFPEWGTIKDSVSTKTPEEAPMVVLAEDSEFFRTQLVDLMTEAGLTVLAGEDGLAAWEHLDQNAAKVSILVTDIEMPKMNGLELSKRVRADSRFHELPIIAVTLLASETDANRGKAAGVTDYQVKLDRERLLTSIKKFLAERKQ